MTTQDSLAHAGDLPQVGRPQFKAHAHARYAELREQYGSVFASRMADGTISWLVVDYELAREALAHPKLSKNPEPFAEELRASGRHILLAGSGFGGNMLMADPPEHTRLRRLVSGAFTTQAVEKLAPRVEELAHELIDAFIEQGATDLVAGYTTPLPITVISELLGVPEEARADLLAWTRHSMGAPSEQQRAGLLALNEYLRDLLAAKRRDPADDLLSRLIAVRDEDSGRLSDTELLGTAVILVVAGHETTVNLLGNAVVALLDHPEQARLLREQPQHISGAVEEFLRYDPPVELAPTRFATEEFELGGQVIRPGETVVVALTAAGRDAPIEAGADPGWLDVLRKHPRHASFGHGIHYCIGAPLARLEGEIALRVLLSRLPDVMWADPAEPVAWLPTGITRGPVRLPVRFTPSAGRDVRPARGRHRQHPAAE